MSYIFRANIDYEKLIRGLEEQLGIKIGQNFQVEHSSRPSNYILRLDQQKECFVLNIIKGGDLSLKHATMCLCDILAVGNGWSPKEQDIQVEVNEEWNDKETAEKIIKNYLPKNALKRLKEEFDHEITKS
ncbi:MAG: hypothetical protein Q7J54_06755 [Candidatus Woesearchaeota archaeon]|nr:hypothetical protein [Candidatus Woesearchaeota archaeon]